MTMKNSKFIALASVLLMLAVAGAALVSADDSDATTQYTVTFDTNGGNTIASQTVDSGASITLPTPTKAGYTCTLWFDQARNAAAGYPGASYIISQTTTLKATWTSDGSKYSLAFSANGGTGAPSTITGGLVSDSDTYSFTIPSATPTRSGYTFLGWYPSSNYTGNTLYNAGDSYSVGKNVYAGTLYAIWSANTTTTYNYTLIYNANGGTGVPSNTTASSSATSATLTVSSTVPTYEHHTFYHWCDQSVYSTGAKLYDGGNTVTLSSSSPSLTLYALWVPDSFSVTFDANGGAGTMASQTYYYEVGQALRANAFTRDSFTFAGWATSSTGTVVYTDIQTVSLTQAITLYAVWNAATPADVTPVPNFEYAKSGMTVTFTDQSTGASTWAWSFGDTLTSTAQNPEHTYTTADDYTVTLTVTSTTGTTATTSQIVTVGGDPDTTYTVTFDANGGSAVESVQATGSSSITLPSCTYASHTFVAWFIGDTQAGVAGAEYQVAGDVTLTAHWADGTVTTYTVSFYLVDGSKQTLDCSQTVISGGKATYYLPSTVGEGYNGWYTSSDFKAKYSFSTPVTTDLSLYCKVTHINPTPEWATIVGYICAVLGAICAIAAIAVMPLLGIPAVVLLALAGYLIWL